MNPNPTTPKTIRSVLKHFCPYEGEDALNKALAEITQIEEEAVGEDEVEDTDLSKSAKSRWGVRARNRVRAETRARLEARRG